MSVDKNKGTKIAKGTKGCQKSLAVLLLVERKLLALDTPLAAYLPEEMVRSEPRLRRATTRMVLSHTSWMAGSLSSLTFGFEPGERFAYSSTGIHVLQLAVHRITGQPLLDFMRQTVLGPLRMENSSFEWTARLQGRGCRTPRTGRGTDSL